jgi:hypothetical protein
VVNLYVGITDYDWFRFLSALSGVHEVNFWQPGGRTNFQALRPGELFLFKLHAPRNFIVGGGVFARADILPTSLAWEAFGASNGAPSLAEMLRRIAFYRSVPDDPRKIIQSDAECSRSRSSSPRTSGFRYRRHGHGISNKGGHTTRMTVMVGFYGKLSWTDRRCSGI